MKIVYKLLLFFLFRSIKSKLKGDLVIMLPNKELLSIGDRTKASIIKVKKLRSLFRLFFLGLSSGGYSYSKGEWETSNLSGVLSIGVKNIRILKSFNIAFRF